MDGGQNKLYTSSFISIMDDQVPIYLLYFISMSFSPRRTYVKYINLGNRQFRKLRFKLGNFRISNEFTLLNQEIKLLYINTSFYFIFMYLYLFGLL